MMMRSLHRASLPRFNIFNRSPIFSLSFSTHKTALTSASTPEIHYDKCVFQGHAARVHSTEELEDAITLITSRKRVKKASHNIIAYRYSNGVIGSRDGGEATAGKKLSRLLELRESQDTLVIVTRWYGGTPLGPARFRVINNIAKDALDLLESIRSG